MGHTLVTFHAHPDDESLLTAGVMAKAASEGHRVVLVVATAGEVGDAATDYRSDDHADIGAARRTELERSAEILGVHRIVHLGYRDSGSGPESTARSLAATGPERRFVEVPVEEAALALAEVLREEHADVLTIYDRNGGYGHPDHLHVHAVGHRAAELAGTAIVLEATINRDLMTMGLELATSLGFEVPDSFSPESFDAWFLPADELTHAVDVNAFIGAKRDSMAAHASQATSAVDGTRSMAVFLSLPDEYFALAFGTEWFVDRRRPAGIAADDVFTDLPGPSA
jgi:LmbE family N-acetylglucosaminyl deacetylase